MKTLVVCEVREGRAHPATPNLISAALRLNAELDVLVAAPPDSSVVAELAGYAGVARIRCLSAALYNDQTAENLAMPLAQIASNYRHMVFAANPFGKGLAPRLAAMLDVAPVSDVIEILTPDTFIRPIYAGNVLTTVVCRQPVTVMTVRPSAFPAAMRGPAQALVDVVPSGPDMGVVKLLARMKLQSDYPALGSARVIVAGGRGLGTKEGFSRLIHPLAERFGAAVGATRAAVDAGFAPHDWQIGQTGQVVAPELYVAVGISGAVQHLAGIRNAKMIVAINKDPEAPIVRLADYSLIGDLEELVPALLSGLAH